MVTKKNEANQVDVMPTSVAKVVATLTTRGYEPHAINSYAKAAKSWCKKDDADWLVWKGVEMVTSWSL